MLFLRIFKGLSLFIITNLLVLLSTALLINYFHLDKLIFESTSIPYPVILIWCFIMGFGCSIINLIFSRYTLKKLYNVTVINKSNRPEDIYFMGIVKEICKKAKLPVPHVGIYQSKEVNAFATGCNAYFAMIAFSTNIFNKLNEEELRGVIAHELAHIKNGDMSTMILIQGLVNTLALFFSRLLTFSIIKKIKTTAFGIFFPTIFLYYIIVGFVDFIMMFFGNFVINWFSRQREFRADLLAVDWVGSDIETTLKKLELLESPQFYNNFEGPYKIMGKSGLSALFSTHPTMNKRIEKVHKKLLKNKACSF